MILVDSNYGYNPLLPTFAIKLKSAILKVFILGLACLVLCGCARVKIEDTKLLNGYWEIEKVSFPSGEIKNYTVNTVIDYYLLTGDSTGIRQKVMPQLDGTFISNDEQEAFTIKVTDKELYLHYSNEDAQHDEKVLKLSENEFVVTNKENLTYHYKPFEKFELK